MDVAAYITTRYQKISNKEIDEMMLYKLLYLVQRDSLAIMGVPAFQEELVVWNNGPISRDVRANYCEGEIICPTEEPSDSVTYIADNVFSHLNMASCPIRIFPGPICVPTFAQTTPALFH